MKRLLVFILLFICLFFINLNNTSYLCEIFAESDECCLITSNKIITAKRSVKNGNCYINYLKSKTACLELNNAQTVYGETMVFNNKNLKFITEKLQLNIVSKVIGNNGVEVLGYSKKLNDFVFVNGKIVNVQIAIFNNKIVVGHPLILQGF